MPHAMRSSREISHGMLCAFANSVTARSMTFGPQAIIFENYKILIAETDRHRGVFAALLCCAEKRGHTDTAADEQIVRVRVERKAVAEGRQNIHLVADLKLRELLCARAANLEHKTQRAVFLIDVTDRNRAAQRFTGHVNVRKLSGLRHFCQFRR